MQPTTYRLYRSNALWFSQRLDGYTVTVRNKKRYHFEKGESLKWARTWATKARSAWNSLSDEQRSKMTMCRLVYVPSAADTLTESSMDWTEKPFTANDATLNQGANCLCPDCADRAIKANYAQVRKIWNTLMFPDKDSAKGVLHDDGDAEYEKLLETGKE